MTVTIEESLRDWLLKTACEEGISPGELLGRGVRAIASFQEQRKIGRNHMGFTSDATKLDAEIIGVLNG